MACVHQKKTAEVRTVAITAKPEVIPPHPNTGDRPGDKTGGRAFSDENLDLLSHLLDDFIRIPGTPIRFGLDGIVGFLPGIGDLLGGLASTLIVFAAWKRGVAPAVVARMVLNVGIETAVGTVPVLGNLFDIGWRANRRNYALLMSAVHGPDTARAARRSWLFIALVCLVLAALVAIPMLLAGWLLLHLTQALQTMGAGHSVVPRR